MGQLQDYKLDLVDYYVVRYFTISRPHKHTTPFYER